METQSTTLQGNSPTEVWLNEAMADCLKGIDKIQLSGEKIQIDMLFNICQVLQQSNSREQLRTELPWIIRRYRLFKGLPRADKKLFIKNIIGWRQSLGKVDGRYVAFLLPGLCNFVCSIRLNRYNETRDGNWYLWWNSHHQEQIDDSDLSIEANKDLLRQVLRYESSTWENYKPADLSLDPSTLPSTSDVPHPKPQPP
ncbi:hypothetical protein K449DRAFT_402299 [Hypoxylon sp. EC38]|nr:hypothetical protein K449DRAFT_402299 [Hypoxylon sp. EC38]